MPTSYSFIHPKFMGTIYRSHLLHVEDIPQKHWPSCIPSIFWYLSLPQVFHVSSIPWIFHLMILLSSPCSLITISYRCVCVCFLVSGLCSVTCYEVVRILKLKFQPQVAATTVLYSWCTWKFFKSYDDVCMNMTRDNIIHILVYNR